MLKFEYTEDGHIYRILDEFNQYQDPKEPISLQITELTGITDAMVKDKAIDKEAVAQFFKDVDIIVAYNATFDRPFFDKMFPVRLLPKYRDAQELILIGKMRK